MLCDPGSELRLGGKENRRVNIINGHVKKKRSSPAHDGAIFGDCAREVAAGSDGDRASATKGDGREVVAHVTGFVTDVVSRALRESAAAAAAAVVR